MKQEIGKILKDVVLWKLSKNIAAAKKAEKIERYLKEFQAGEITERELVKLLEQQAVIDQMNASAEEMELTRKINDAVGIIKTLLKNI